MVFSAITRSRPRLLIVEDELSLLSYLRLLFKRDYEVYTAENSAEADKVIQRKEIEVILCDHDMPGEKGLDFLSRIKHQYPKTQRVLMTAHAEREVFLKAINEGDVLKFLVKPAPYQDIRAAVALGLKEYERRAELETQERRNRELEHKVHSVPFLTRRVQSVSKSLVDAFGTTLTAGVVGLGIIFLIAVAGFVLLYLLQHGLGINLLGG